MFGLASAYHLVGEIVDPLLGKLDFLLESDPWMSFLDNAEVFLGLEIRDGIGRLVQLDEVSLKPCERMRSAYED